MTDIITARVLSQRGLLSLVSRCMGYEFEDRAVSLLGGELISPTHSKVSKGLERVIRGVAKRVDVAVPASPRYETTDVSGTSDLLLVHCQFVGDLMLLRALPKWRSRTYRAVVFIEELWRNQLDSWGGLLRQLEHFDQVYVGVSGTADALAQRLDTPVSYMPYSVDTLRFAPVDPLADRPIRVLNIGRRSMVTHAALVEWSRRGQHFYYFDSYKPAACHDFAEHRVMYSRLHQQAEFAISNRGVGAVTADNPGEEALPARFFEAAAAGGVLVGQPPRTPSLESEFGWPDAIIEAPFDEPAMPEILSSLRSSPDRLRAIRLRNIEELLRRHDNAHRLRAMLDAVGLPEPPALFQHIVDTTERADQIAAQREQLG